MIATRNGFEVLHFPVMQSSFNFTYVELMAVPTASLLNNPGHLRTGESVFVGKKRLNTMCALESTHVSIQRCMLEHTKHQDNAFFLSRNAFIFPYVYHRGLPFVSS